jgi:hypothetical protein
MDVFDLFAKITLDTSEYTKGLSDASNSGKETSQSIGSAFGNVVKAGAVAVGAVTGIGGSIVALASKTADYGSEVNDMSKKIGISAQAYQQWNYVMKLNGTSVDNLKMGMKTLSAQAESGSDAFQKLGISQEQVASMNQEQLFSAVIDGLSGMSEGTERTTLATQLLGRAGVDLGAMLDEGTEKIDEEKQAALDMGIVMSDDAVAASDDFGDSLDTLKMAMAGAGNSLMSELLPNLTDFIKGITDFINEGKLDQLIQMFKDWSPLIAGVTAAFVAFKVASSIAGVITAVSTAIKAAQASEEGLTIAQWLLNAAMNANPFVLIATLIAGLVVAMITLYNTNEDFRNKVDVLWKDIKRIFTDPIGSIERAWDGITTFFDNLGTDIGNSWNNLVNSAWSWGSDMIDNFISGITQKWQDLKNTVSNVAQTVANFLGFSEPKEGPLSRFHTYAPDMMELFAKGISDNENIVTGQISKSFNFGDAITAPTSSPLALATAGGAGISINIYPAEGSDAKEIAREVKNELITALGIDGATYGN